MNNLNRLQKLLKTIDENKTYFNVHAGDILGCFFLIIIFILSFLYLSIKKRNVIIRKEWDIHKCKPEISPFAGLINAPPGSTFKEKMDYTAQNYKACNVGILEKNMKLFTTPLENSQGIIRYIFEMAKETVVKIKNLLMIIKMQIMKMVMAIFSKIFQVVIELQKIVFKLKDILMKATGVLQTVFLLLVAQAYTFITFLNSLIEVTVIILIIITIFYILLFTAGYIFLVMPLTQAIGTGMIIGAIGLLGTYLAMAIPMLIVIIFLAMLNDHIKKQEDLTCFHPNTKIELLNGKYKLMKNLNLGEKLKNNIEVIAVLRIKGEPKDKYYKIYSKEMGEFIYVTGSHLIFDSDKNKYISVADFKDAILTNYWSSEMSCLVTSTHEMPIGGFTFWDWED